MWAIHENESLHFNVQNTQTHSKHNAHHPVVLAGTIESEHDLIYESESEDKKETFDSYPCSISSKLLQDNTGSSLLNSKSSTVLNPLSLNILYCVFRL
ncbi:MAG: hypothetical protein JNM67_00615 [Bacteroidetes bacterium]|nr:hypothetical protein [Bacteroidota bacterium]